MTTLDNRPNTALLVIDVQNGVVDGSHNRDEVVANVATLVDKARAAGVDVVWVAHNSDDLPLDSEQWQYVPELKRDDIAGARVLNVTAHVQKNDKGRRSNLDERAHRHAGYALSLSRRWLVEKTFGWLKQTGPLDQLKVRGLAKVDWIFVFSCAAHNLLRLPRLIQSHTQQDPQQQCA